ncbi:hypothetical protein ACQPX6_16940 [Actinomycetospora sp. CA-101289]|uniref:hypothetical protein n=1 Tax=Actinomycetospora sp. CA-101289 TaxID=3239893 RepID=UPI003D978E85
MPGNGSIDVERVLEQAHAAIVDVSAGGIVAEHVIPEPDDEIALHAPLKREHPGPMEIDPATEAVLQQHLGGVERVPQPRPSGPDSGDR